MTSLGSLRLLWVDVHQALRGVARGRGFAAGAVLTLALGIGASCALFTVLYAVLLRPLPYAAPERLLTLQGNQSAPDVEDLAAGAPPLASAGLFFEHPLDLAGPSALPERLEGAGVTGGLLGTLGVPPALGRLLGPGDDRVGAPPVAVLSHALWRDRFGADPQVLGRLLSLSGQGYTVVGVMPPHFRLPRGRAEVLVPARAAHPEGVAARGAHFLYPVARLAEGATLPAAQAAVDAVAERLRAEHPEETREMTYVLQPLHARMVGPVRPVLLVLLGAVGLVLLVACSTFANLLLARAGARARELAVRSALGASRARLVGQLLGESVLLAALGAAAGLVLALWGVDALRALAPPGVPGLEEARVDGVVLAVTAGVALLSGVLAGLVPALQASRASPADALASGGRGLTGGRTAARARQVLVTAQLALALVLLVGCGLLLRSLWRLQGVDLGFEPAGTLALKVDLPAGRYPTVDVQARLLRGLLERARAQGGVAEAGLLSELPLAGERMNHNVLVEGMAEPAPGDEPSAEAHLASEGALEALRVPLLRGRGLRASDDAGAPPVVLVNAAFVKAFLGGREPLGARVRWAREDGVRWMTVAGVVGDIRHRAPDAWEGPTVYVPFAQNPVAWKRTTHLLVRTPLAAGGAAPAALVSALQEAAAGLDPLLPLTKARTLEQVLQSALATRRFQAVLLGVFAALALVLATLGVGGVTAFLVSQRTRELSIRLALGARRGEVLGLVLRQALAVVATGCAVGLAAAAALSRTLAALLFDVAPVDAATYGVLALGLAAVAMLASAVPALRVTRVDPALALRAE
jgi:predicted permease